MKKILWAVGIFIFSLIVTAALLIFNALLLVFMLYPVPLITSVLAASGTVRLCRRACVKYGISAWAFPVLAFLVPFITGIGTVAVVCAGLLGGAFNVQPYTPELYDLAVTCLSYGISGAIFTRSAANKLKRVNL